MRPRSLALVALRVVTLCIPIMILLRQIHPDAPVPAKAVFHHRTSREGNACPSRSLVSDRRHAIIRDQGKFRATARGYGPFGIQSFRVLPCRRLTNVRSKAQPPFLPARETFQRGKTLDDGISKV